MANAPLPWRLAHGGEDPTYYPSDDDEMGTNTLELILRELLRPLIAYWLAQRGVRAFVGADQFIYYKQFDATRRVSPDLYVHPNLPPEAAPPSIKTWELGPPTFALEIVSLDKQKDYIDSPIRYEKVGVRELVIYDPEWSTRPEGRRFQVYAVERGKGFVRVDETNDDWIYSQELGCCLREIKGPGYPLLRLARGPIGRELIPTEAERLSAERDEQARKAQESARQAQESAQQSLQIAREAVLDLCELLGIGVDAARQAQLDAMGLDDLSALRARLKASRAWPAP